jgi:hypothetical protein
VFPWVLGFVAPTDSEPSAVAIIAGGAIMNARSRHVMSSCALVALVAIGAPRSAIADRGRSIGVYFDEAGTVCTGTIEPGVPTNLYIVIRCDEGVGVEGCEFRFRGGPASWHTFPVANPTILAIGDPLANGITAGFGQCQGLGQTTFVVYSVLVLADAPEQDVLYELQGRIPPTNPNFRCPLVVDCFPQYQAHCVTNIKCRVNSWRPGHCALLTAVEASSWSAVKGLYRGQ